MYEQINLSVVTHLHDTKLTLATDYPTIATWLSAPMILVVLDEIFRARYAKTVPPPFQNTADVLEALTQSMCYTYGCAPPTRSACARRPTMPTWYASGPGAT